MRKIVLCVVLALFLCPFPSGAEGTSTERTEETNYCHDPGAEAGWIALLAKDPKDFDLQTLHAMRMGLCAKVDQGVLSVAEATEIFEDAREALVEYRAARERQERQKSKLNL